MILRDQFRYAFDNLRRTRLRTVLTAAGVAIGIGAMTSMVSVGNGTQRNVLRAVNEQYVLTSVMVQPADSTEHAGDTTRSLDPAAVAAFKGIPGVRDAYPIIALPGLLIARGERLFQSLEGMPAWLLAEQVERGRVEITAGRVYREGDTAALVLSERAARRLLPDSTPPDSLVGTEVQFLVAQAASQTAPPTPTIDPHTSLLPLVASSVGRFQPTTLSLTVVGIIKGGGTFGDFVGVSLWVPMETVEPLHASAFRDLGSLLTGETQGGGYGLVQVLTGSVMSVRQVQDSIAVMGFSARSILDEIAEIRRAFVIMNGLLAMIGGVSLAVAAMMIVNTLVMAVLERTREIGLLKSMGATDSDVMRLFLSEAGVIGLVGGGTGLVLGYGVARLTNVIANMQFERVGEIKVNLVAFPAWLIAGGLAFAVVVSLVAGFYPARRAAKVDPVVALRHF